MRAQAELTDFLQKWKIASSKFIDFVPRNKNIQGLKELNLTMELARKMLRGLAIENYVSGPEMDMDRGTKDIWIFGMPMEKEEIYIKVKIFKYANEYRAKCLSFHPAEYPLRYPFAGGQKS